MKADLNDLETTMELMKHGDATKVQKDREGYQKIYGDNDSSRGF